MNSLKRCTPCMLAIFFIAFIAFLSGYYINPGNDEIQLERKVSDFKQTKNKDELLDEIIRLSEDNISRKNNEVIEGNGQLEVDVGIQRMNKLLDLYFQVKSKEERAGIESDIKTLGFPFVEILIERIQKENDLQTKAKLINLLSAIGGKDSLKFLQRELLSENNIVLKRVIASGFVKVPDKSSIDLLSTALYQEEDSALKSSYIAGLGAIKSMEASMMLISIYHDSRDVDDKMKILGAFMRKEDVGQEITRFLEDIAGNTNSMVLQSLSVQCLGKFGSASTLGMLEALLSRSDFESIKIIINNAINNIRKRNKEH